MRVLVSVAVAMLAALPPSPGQPPTRPKLLMAFCSYKGPRLPPTVFFYEHDGVGSGQIVGTIDAGKMSRHDRPTLTADGTVCSFVGSREGETGRMYLWERAAKRLLVPPGLNDTPNGMTNCTISADGKWLAFAAWNRTIETINWQLYRYDVVAKRFVNSPGLNDAKAADKAPSLSGDGRFLAFETDRPGGAGMSDIALYDTTAKADVELPGLNSPQKDLTPSLSADARLIAFGSDRPGGVGKQDIYLYDRTAKALVPLPGLNQTGDEWSPALSTKGRYLAFVADRAEGEGAGDIFLYDRTTSRLIPTPGLNSRAYDFDPCVVELP